ncbi:MULTISPECIES: hypothetical protein [Mycobacteroides]|uniref:hypothetical protein n=1 Tax=Mycobacteroides TaxID=670516 RepID=UPI000992E239|nr:MULTISPECIES: hypothetical protein [Mycobacteroides]SKR76815.1 gp75 protein [Mycobacteroides abscessus subsp. abscessus]SLC82414.1 gp75 protein [Mycobacteroides abscessus subsp. massiliense]
MTKCRKCSQKCDLFLCTDCIDQLQEHLTEIAWLIGELEITLTGQDVLTTGGVGQSSEDPSPIRFDSEGNPNTIGDQTRNAVTTWVRDLCETRRITFEPVRVVPLDFIGPLPDERWRRLPQRYQPTAADAAEWLAEHVHAIAADPGAARCFKEMADLRAGALRMINRPDRHFAGPCPTIKAYSRTGKAIECGKFLYGATDERSITCPACKQPVDVQRNRQRAWREGDRLTERILLKRLKDIEEPVSERQLYRWLRQRKLAPVGWLHKGVFVEHYILRGDPRVFSLRTVRQLRAAELKAGRVGAEQAAPEPDHDEPEADHTAPKPEQIEREAYRHASRTYGQSEPAVEAERGEVVA